MNKTLTLNDYRRHTIAGTIRKAFCTELGSDKIVWFDFGRGRGHRSPFVITL
jgi:hypothetical protein